MIYNSVVRTGCIACLSLVFVNFGNMGAIAQSIAISGVQPQQIQTKANDSFFQGLEKAKQRDYQDAVSEFTQAIQINPQYAEAYYQRGLIYGKLAKGEPLKPGRILSGCEKVNEYTIACKPDLTAKWKKENQRKAIADLTQAIQLNPQYAQAYHQRGLVEEEQPKKISDLKTARKFYFKSFSAYLKQMKYPQATDTLEEIEKVYAEENYLAMLSLTEEERSERTRGSSTVSPERKQSPDRLMNEAKQALRKGDTQTAIQKYREAARILRDRKEDSKYQQVENIITELEQNSNGYSKP
ncbi:MAG: tetratricopeptide repeat protein [Stigonema ocellatum SAG 48.90 = DSM 106950]|nr:tetratricopeptide repeat protein [Stigonema ocellatum SAG 48.90 = DSM 106950]